MNKGIYKIINLVNNKIYIGSSNNIKKRFSHHKHSLINNKHYNKYLQNSFNKYTINNFKFEILEECSKENLLIREQYYLDLLKPEYNLLKVAGSNLGTKFTQEHKNKIGNSNKNKVRSEELKERWSNIKKDMKYNHIYKNLYKKALPYIQRKIVQLDLDENIIKYWNSISECCRSLNLDNSSITKVCKGKLNYHKGYKFKYID